VNLSIKNVPDDLAERPRERARRNHRSLQGELLAILEQAGKSSERTRTIGEVVEEVERLGIRSPGTSAAIVRELRDRIAP
jgi:antitoxin FitA